jgi:D-glycero-D-manno-heptose 1,7-bisphosphate phosphatase
LKVCEGAADALERLRRAGFLLIVVTNQPDVARRTQSRAGVEAIHRALSAVLPIDEFYTCWHDDAACCGCRKPKPGLILDAARVHGIDLERSFLVGDRWRDIDAGAAAGCLTVLIERNYAERASEKAPDYRAGSLSGAVEWMLRPDASERT